VAREGAPYGDRVRLPLVLVVSSVLLAACASGSSEEPSATLTPSITGVEVVKGLSHRHLTNKDDYPHSYPRTPPVGGEHAPRWLRCDVYREPVPNELAVHSMEHGGIWITYQPTLDRASLDKLGQIEKTNLEYILVSPFEGLPSPVVVTAWGLQLRLPGVDDPRLLAFIKTYAGGGQGGEAGFPCRKDGLTPEQVPAFISSLD
jgi:hypothetical protein